MPDVETKPEELKEAAPQAPEPEEYKFPNIDKGAGVFYEDEKHQVWIGLPLEAFGDPTVLMAAIDGSKMAALTYLSRYHQYLVRKAQLEIGPAGKKIQGTMNDLFKKGKEVALKPFKSFIA